MSKLFIHAINIHVGGGKSLLQALIRVDGIYSERVLLLDDRFLIPKDVFGVSEVKRIRPSIFSRIQAEWWLLKNVRECDTVLCFGNLPPLFKLSGRVIVFVHNRYLVNKSSLENFNLKSRFRLTIERSWFWMKSKNANQFLVQTPSMKSALQLKLGFNDSLFCNNDTKVNVYPFINFSEFYQRKLIVRSIERKVNFNFLYVASGEPHKNHKNLIEAWCLLAEEGYFPSLCLTLDELCFPDLCKWIDLKKSCFHLKVENLGLLSHDRILHLYYEVGALIYPSLLESLGLPLIEARQSGLPVIASEMDYVRDVLDPEQTFDPSSSVSICRAVKRFLELDEQPLPLLDAKEFLIKIHESLSS